MVDEDADVYSSDMDFDNVENADNYAQILDAADGNVRSLKAGSNYVYGHNADGSSGASGILKADL